jgi:hypothetical protein
VFLSGDELLPSLPFTLAVFDVADGLAALAAAILGRVARGGLRGFVAAGPTAHGKRKKIFAA